MIETTLKNGVLVIRFNDPRTKNALDSNDYERLAEILNKAATDDEVRLAVLTGAGRFYSSGNNIKALLGDISDDVEQVLKEKLAVLREMVKAYIQFPKLLIGLVNGPCIGITATTVALCDVIYCSKDAYFWTPFSSLGLCAEGCGSYTFPRILGKSKANEMLLLNHKLSAQEAKEYNFVARVFEDGELPKIWQEIEDFARLPVGSIATTKRLTRMFDRAELLKVNETEIEELNKRFMSEEAVEAILNFSSRKSKL